MERGGKTSHDLLGKVGTPELLASLALGKISGCPFPPEEIDALKQGVISFFQTKGLSLERHHEDRRDVPFDFRYLSLLLQAAQDPEISLGEISRGVRVGSGVRLSPLLAIDEGDPSIHMEEEIIGDPLWRQLLVDDRDVLNDQSSMGSDLGGGRYRAALITFFVLCATTGIPLSCVKPQEERCYLGRIRATASILPARNIGTKSAADPQLDPKDRRFDLSQR